jgi:predicted dinucleotide-binding enzyme
MNANAKPTIGIVGAGMIGGALAGLFSRAGYDVILSSRHPEQLSGQVAALGAKVRAAAVSEAARAGNVVVVTIPLKSVPEVAKEIGPLVAGKIVIDTNNPYPQRDGAAAADATKDGQGSGVWFAAHFPDSRVVKAFNSVYFKTLLARAHDREHPLGIPLASDDLAAMNDVAAIVTAAGFTPVIVGPLARSAEFDAGTPPYNTGAGPDELRRMLNL